jgi:two-component system, OmpR family, response regulator
MRVLVVEDDPAIAAFVVRGLREAGYTVDTAADGDTGLDLAMSEPFDLAVVDLMLPRRDGLSLIEEIRTAGVTMPVLILTAKRSVDDRVKGLQSGGDDYLTKPFAFAELLARVQALLRRAQRVPESQQLVVGDLTLDRLTRRVERGHTPLDLRPREFALLELLMRRRGEVVPKSEILRSVWDSNYSGEPNVVEVYVGYLRRKIDAPFSRKALETVRGVGYRLAADGG